MQQTLDWDTYHGLFGRLSPHWCWNVEPMHWMKENYNTVSSLALRPHSQPRKKGLVFAASNHGLLCSTCIHTAMASEIYANAIWSIQFSIYTYIYTVSYSIAQPYSPEVLSYTCSNDSLRFMLNQHFINISSKSATFWIVTAGSANITWLHFSHSGCLETKAV